MSQNSKNLRNLCNLRNLRNLPQSGDVYCTLNFHSPSLNSSPVGKLRELREL